MTGVLFRLALEGLALAAVLLGLGLALDRAPLSIAGRAAVARARPIVLGAASLAFALHAVARLFQGEASAVRLALAAVLLLAVAATWFALRDLAAGVVLRASGLLAVGATLRGEALEGRIERLGPRILVLRSPGGEERVVPYSTLARISFARVPPEERAGRRVFELAVPPGADRGELARRVEEATLASHWAALGSAPEVVPRGADRLEVTVFALDAEHAPALEDAVRAALAG